MESTQNKTRCPHSKKCGGCQLQNLDYKEQLAHKERTCIRLLGKFCRVEPIIGMENPYHYRNKVQAAFGTTRAGRIISGIYQSSTHNIVAVDSCMTEDEIADRIIVDIRRLLRDFKMTTYNEVTGRGFLRHVLVKRGFQTGEVMVVLVTGTPIFPARNNFTRALLKLHPEITTIIQNVNDRYTSMLLGQNEKTLYGPGYITDILCGLRFRISAKSFYQINPVQTEVLYGKAMEFAELTGKETVIDAYCGIGTIGMVAAKKAGQVLGVEVNRDAVRDAISNAKANRADNVRFYTADASDFLQGMAKAGEPERTPTSSSSTRRVPAATSAFSPPSRLWHRSAWYTCRATRRHSRATSAISPATATASSASSRSICSRTRSISRRWLC